jgi:hypothetical protein
MNIINRLLLNISIVLVSITIIGCAGIKGTPEFTMQTKEAVSELDCYLKADVLVKTSCNNPTTTGINASPTGKSIEWRNDVINARIVVADLQFRDFVNELSSQGTGLNLLSDFAVIGLGTAGALATGGATNVLSAASAAVTGARGAVDKDVYYKETLPSLVRTMEANRKLVLLDIKTSMKELDESQYSLGDALNDLHRYEEAGTLHAALSTITGTADEVAKKADAELKTALFTSFIASEPLHKRKAKLSNYIRELEQKNDRDKLDRISKVLNTPVNPNIKEEGKAIRLELDKQINSDDNKMDSISTLLKPITQQDF